MFQFRRFPSYTYLFQYMIHEYCPCVFPHSEISGSTLICSSPKLFAACHVLHRLLMPRHSPCALFSLTFRQTVACLIQVLLNYAGSTRSSFEIVFTLFIKVFHNLLSLNSWNLFHAFPLLPCFSFSLSSFQGAVWAYITVPSKLNNARYEKVWPGVACSLFGSTSSP